MAGVWRAGGHLPPGHYMTSRGPRDTGGRGLKYSTTEWFTWRGGGVDVDTPT